MPEACYLPYHRFTMGSVGFGEIAFIAIVALLVFGPDRLPELARKAGELLTKAREATRSFTDALDGEFKDAAAPLRTLQADFEATKDELRSAAGTVMDLNLDVPMDKNTTPTPSGTDDKETEEGSQEQPDEESSS